MPFVSKGWKALQGHLVRLSLRCWMILAYSHGSVDLYSLLSPILPFSHTLREGNVNEGLVRDTICLAGAYHGVTTASDEVGR